MSKYDYKQIEAKWQSHWEENATFAVKTGAEADTSKPPYYVLVEFPYPSGKGLHIGHPRPYTAMDILARTRRLQGYNVLYPFGWDAFGLPTENYAIKNKIHPAKVTADNIEQFTKQAKAIGFSFDWSREINTTDPAYYKWTQWIFLQMFKHGLAYKKEMAVNWCTDCKVVLANEEVIDGKCERCQSDVVRKVKSQWMLRITAYAQRLLDDLELVDYPERVKATQINWIGRSVGAEVKFALKTKKADLPLPESTPSEGEDVIVPTRSVTVFTTRPDTLFGATYMVLSPEHPYVSNWLDTKAVTNADEITAYIAAAAKKSDFERAELAKDKTGVRLDGVYAINPVNDAEIPIYISDYVLMSYGTGAIMAVPAHDTRDYEFATKFGLPIVEVVAGGDISKEAYTDCDKGVMVNSGMLDGLSVEEAKAKITAWLTENKLGREKVNFKLRDWIFSRQRYWGEPIPMVYCAHCAANPETKDDETGWWTGLRNSDDGDDEIYRVGKRSSNGGWIPLPFAKLPLVLPDVESYMPTDTGESPLAELKEFTRCKCPRCGRPAKRETDTMPQWAGSSWYYLRYCDPNNTEELASKEALDYWCGSQGVNWYNGGMEHTTLHLLYSRFWHKFLYDIGVVSNPEPYAKRTAHGVILGMDGQKMSKSSKNAVDPGEMIEQFGADSLRLYEMFIGDFEKSAPWNVNGIKGCKRFLDRVWNLQPMICSESSDVNTSLLHRTIKKVTDDIESLKYNTAISALMTLCNAFYDAGKVSKDEFATLLTLLNPFAPHITEELAEVHGFGEISKREWPKHDPALCVDKTVEVVVQVCGKVRGRVTVAAGTGEAELVTLAKAEVSALLEGKTVVKEIVVPDKLVNIVVK